LAARALPVLCSVEQVKVWAQRGRAAVQIDTGMTRLGLAPAEVDELARHPELLAGIDVDLVLTHFACADEPEHPLNRLQVGSFERLRTAFASVPVSIGNSAGTLIDAAHRGHVVRPGIALYGGNPFVASENPMEGVVTLTAPIIQVRDIEHAQTVGYGATY